MPSSEPSLTVLFSSAGRRVALMGCFRDAAAGLGIDLRVLAVDIDPELSAACAIADHAVRVPRCTEPGFAEVITEVVRGEGVQLIVPTIDTELAAYAAARAQLQEAGAWVSVPAPELVAMARDKLITAERLTAGGIAVARTATLEAALVHREVFSGPVILKPRNGSASNGIRELRSIAHLGVGLDEADAVGDAFIVQERLTGPEYTVNLFFDRAGALRSVVPHRRIEVRAGEVSKARTVREPRLIDQAVRLAKLLDGAAGSLCYQVIDVDRAEEPRVIEVNARFGGGYPVAHRAGAPFARWILEEACGRAPSVSGLTDWREGITMLRYDAAVFSE
jgi:carbamoyl-phosphate synthase large subunit